MTDQIPSVGRIVHYTSYGTPGGEYETECRAAIITEVEDARTVSLAVLNPTGAFFNRDCHRAVARWSGSDGTRREYTQGGTWHWPERV